MAELDPEYFELFKILAEQIPEMAVSFLGMLIAVAKWRQYPRPALLAFLGFGLLLVGSIGSVVVEIWVLRYFNFNEEIFFLIAWTGRSVLFAVAYVLLICAIFAARKPRAPLPSYHEGPRNEQESRKANHGEPGT